MIRKIRKLIRRMIDAFASDIHTHMVAQVISFDADENLVAVQPCIKVMRTDDPNNITTTMLPTIEDVPVQQFGSGKLLLSCAPQAGSYGVLHVAERSLSNWIVQGGIVEPGSIRKFDMTDCFFTPGVYPIKVDGNNGKLAAAINTDRIEIRNRDCDTFVAVLDNGTVEIENASGYITVKASGQVDVNGNLTVDP